MHYREAPRKVSTDWPPKFMKVRRLMSRLFVVTRADRRRSLSCTYREKAMKKLSDRISLQGRTIETALVEYEQKAILAGMMTGDEQHGLFHITNLKKVLPDQLIGTMANI